MGALSFSVLALSLGVCLTTPRAGLFDPPPGPTAMGNIVTRSCHAPNRQALTASRTRFHFFQLAVRGGLPHPKDFRRLQFAAVCLLHSPQNGLPLQLAQAEAPPQLLNDILDRCRLAVGSDLRRQVGGAHDWPGGRALISLL